MAIGTTAAILGAAVIGGGASIISGNKAASSQKKAADQAAANERYFYDTTREDYRPWRDTGKKALTGLEQAYGLAPSEQPYGGFFTSPGYQFRLDEGLKAIERTQSARGSRSGPINGMSGATTKAVMRYGEGLAASEYDAYSSRLAQLAGFGQSATGGTAQAGATAARGISNALTASGNARASSYANTGSSINYGINSALNAYLMGGFGGGGGGRIPNTAAYDIPSMGGGYI